MYYANGILVHNCWYMPGPRTLEVIDECASFPRGKSDDWCDTVTCAVIWARNKSFLELPSDALDEAEEAELESDEFKNFGMDGRRLYGGGRVTGGPANATKPTGVKRRGYG